MPGSATALIGECDTRQLTGLARHGHLCLRCGPFNIRLHSDQPDMVQLLQRLYHHQQQLDSRQSLSDFSISLQRPWGLRRWWRPQVMMRTDAQTPFEPFPLNHAFPLFEWSLNWLIATQAHQFLMLHSAVVEKDGVALIMPALPGSGKSTLCAALMLRGWRLISDEFGLIRPNDPELLLHPLPRPIPLKNTSIEVIRSFSDKAVLGPIFPKTRKGDVAHLMADRDSQLRGNETAVPGWFLFPKYQQGAELALEPLARGWTFLKVSGNSFNYKLQGARGFRAVAELVKRCPAFSLGYSDLDQAIQQIEAVHTQIVAGRRAGTGRQA